MPRLGRPPSSGWLLMLKQRIARLPAASDSTQWFRTSYHACSFSNQSFGASKLPQGEVGGWWGFPKHFLRRLILVLLCTTVKSSSVSTVFYPLHSFNHSLLKPQPLATSSIACSARLLTIFSQSSNTPSRMPWVLDALPCLWEQPLTLRHNRPGPCFDFQRGRCRRGTYCRFSHDTSTSTASSPSTTNQQLREETETEAACRKWTYIIPRPNTISSRFKAAVDTQKFF